MPESNAERAFITYWKTSEKLDHWYIWEREYKFDPKRKWKFDFALSEIRLAVEIEGGVYTQGRHTRGRGYEADCEKYNRAVELGWVVLRYTPNMLETNPLAIIAQIENVIRSRSHDIGNATSLNSNESRGG